MAERVSSDGEGMRAIFREVAKTQDLEQEEELEEGWLLVVEGRQGHDHRRR
jgi:hypothetical protein